MTYVIWSARWVDKISDNPYLNDTPDANFLLVEMSIRNNDAKARQIPPFKLVDKNGAEYESSSKSFRIADAIGPAIRPLDSLNPSVIKQGTKLFDIPNDRTYKLLLDGGFWSAEKKVVELTID